MFHRFSTALLISWFAMASCTSASGDSAQDDAPRPLERVEISENEKGFVLAGSGDVFHPYGHNYVGNDGRLLEDYWIDEWETVVEDFRGIKSTGANVIRIHLQFNKFVKKDSLDEAALDRLEKLLHLAEEVGIHLDVTGLACYRKSDTPEWYDAMNEQERWAAQARFWKAVAARCADSPAVFCYDLMNEPIAPAKEREPGSWLSGELDGYHFIQYISLDRKDRPRHEIARQWMRTLRSAIRKEDPDGLVTVGLLPWTKKWGHLSGFLPKEVAPELDFMSVHKYPESGKVDQAIQIIKRFQVGKPLVIEETFPLRCGVDELEEFLLASRKCATGWMGHYWGWTIEEYNELAENNELTMQQAIFRSWLRLFRDLRPQMTGESAEPPAGR